jgi:uroporphyrin-3 C-methyltransferase
VSEKDHKNIEQVVEEAETADGLGNNGDTAVEPPEPHVPVTPPAPPSPPPARKSFSAVAWLALLLVLALAGAAAWYLQDLLKREAVLLDRLAVLEQTAGQRENNLEQLGERWRAELETGLGELRQEAAGQARSAQSLEEQLTAVRSELARFSANDRESWLLAETEYLLRLANQRLIMAGDTESAQALLSSADKVLRELDDVALHTVRAAVASDIAAVRAVPSIDTEGIYLRLSALVDQAGKLVIFEFPEQESQPGGADADTWQGRLEQGYEQALLRLSDYVIIRRRDVPMQALMDPQWEGLVRQNLRMLLEQAQVALLSSNQTLYQASLERARHWVAEFFESDAAAAQAMDREIRQLADLQVAAVLPDISGSLNALDDAIERRLQQGGSE